MLKSIKNKTLKTVQTQIQTSLINQKQNRIYCNHRIQPNIKLRFNTNPIFLNHLENLKSNQSRMSLISRLNQRYRKCWRSISKISIRKKTQGKIWGKYSSRLSMLRNSFQILISIRKRFNQKKKLQEDEKLNRSLTLPIPFKALNI